MLNGSVGLSLVAVKNQIFYVCAIRELVKPAESAIDVGLIAYRT